MSRTRLAVVGVGALGRHHARILAGFDDVELVAVADANPELGGVAAETHGCRHVTDYRKILGEIDAVSIATPTVTHFDIARTCLLRGLPTLIEKPITSEPDTAEELVAIAEQQQTVLQIGHVERFNPASQVAFAAAGSPRYIRAERVSPYAFRSTDVGAVHDLMIHDIDLVLSVVNSPVRSVEAFGVCVFGGHEDTANARITFENGCIADLTANRICPTAHRKMQLWSDSGFVSVDFTSREVVRFAPSEALAFGVPVYQRASQPNADVAGLRADVFTKFVPPETLPVSDDDALTGELRSFVDCAQTNRTPVCSGTDGLKAVQLAEQILASIAAHQWDGNANGRIGAHLAPKVIPMRKAG